MSRTLDPDLDRRILDAAGALADERGLDGVTVSAVAERAGVGRPTVYRRWPTRAALVFEMQTRRTVPVAPPDLGDIRAELIGALDHLVHTLADADRDVHAEQLSAMIADAAFAGWVIDQRWAPDREAVHEIWARGVERGQVSPDVDGRAVLDDIVGAVLLRVLFWHRSDTDWVPGLVDRVLDGVRATP